MTPMDNQSRPDKPAQDSALIAQSDRPQFLGVNRRHFGFRHNLAKQPICTIDGLVALAERIPDYDGFKYWQNGTIDITDGWNAQPAKRLTLRETIEGISTSNSVVVLKHVEQDAVFGPVLRDLLQEVFEASPQSFRDDVSIGECLIFINSPNRKTAYHFDLEPSFLLQVSGQKTVFAWPNGDRTLTTEQELETYCAGEHSAAIYKPERQHDAAQYDLTPGLGVHFPSTGPHWVQNGADVSISVNVNFDMRSSHQRLQHAYAVNSRLRKLGLKPTPPGAKPWLDDTKAGLWSLARQVRRVGQSITAKRNPAELYPVWKPVRADVGDNRGLGC
ncbi:MAG: hypothetical protein ABWZ40_11970 [Caulobacterales bacterium]